LQLEASSLQLKKNYMTEEIKNDLTNIGSTKRDLLKNKFSYLLILNLILLIGLAILYFLYFKQSKNKSTGETISQITGIKKPSKIVYINTDTILNNYELAKDLKKDFENERNKLDAELNAKKSSFENEAASFQKKIQTNSIKTEEAQITEKKLQEKQSQLYELNETYNKRLGEEQMQMNITINDSIIHFLNRYYKNKYDYILGYTPGSTVLYANGNYEITAEVVKAINLEYQQKRSSK